uniref:UDP-glycosyltransferases domain-containing protein n=1 Tax=Chromera velia CCMP2878 TaxID=1169474 RepID=A0A0G4HQF3_9ALVE|eukprot:Cvel_30158.t1-p1 / transcript=Cvel_30158.t1 / gene=Cvel_30158 / organism=Chromera_velia_CCMP2878 / gene_product=UDP-glucuronosyltransferase 1-6, putative / transcript_product=UDP-glucuronosyltransferase 1-6, putative / location=Cvel_scaffold4260:7858-9879(-) / protein_length=571 / sequence_SO=supercontig / SO=protein_coding / is_pseudo=false
MSEKTNSILVVLDQGAGHTNPSLPLLHALCQNPKTKVTVVCSAGFQKAVTKCGAHEVITEEELQDPEFESFADFAEQMLLPNALSEMPCLMVKTLCWHFLSLRPFLDRFLLRSFDCIIYDPFDTKAVVLAKMTNTPCVSLITFTGYGSIWDECVDTAEMPAAQMHLKRVLEIYGDWCGGVLPIPTDGSESCCFFFSHDLNLVTSPSLLNFETDPEFQPKVCQLFDQYKDCTFPIGRKGLPSFDRNALHLTATANALSIEAARVDGQVSDASDVPLLGSLAALKAEGRKIVVVSFGSVLAENLFEGIQGILTTGCDHGKTFIYGILRRLEFAFRDRDDLFFVASIGVLSNETHVWMGDPEGETGDGLENIPPPCFWPTNFKLVPHFPQREVLPFASAFITHCGAGGMTEAIEAGVPCVTLPTLGDQMMNALHLRQTLQMAVAEWNLHEGVFLNATADRLKSSLERALSDPLIRQNALAARAALERDDCGVEKGVEAILRLCSEGRGKHQQQKRKQERTCGRGGTPTEIEVKESDPPAPHPNPTEAPQRSKSRRKSFEETDRDKVHITAARHA